MEKPYDDIVIRSAPHLFRDPVLAEERIEKAYSLLSGNLLFSPNADKAFADLFRQGDRRAALPGESLRLIGEPPRTNVEAFRAMSGKTIEFVPTAILLDQAVGFASLYNYRSQDRSDRVTRAHEVNFGKAVLPYLVAYLCLRNPYSFAENSLSFESGSMLVSFVAKTLPFLHGTDIPSLLESDISYEILVRQLGLVEPEDFSKAFACPEFKLVEENVSSTLRLSYTPEWPRSALGLDERILRYLETSNGASRKEMAAYFGISDRMMSYRLQALVESGKVLREGSLTSPRLIYRKKGNDF